MAQNRKLVKTSDQRRAMLRAMTTYLLENGQIKTTYARAKEVPGFLPSGAQLHHQGGCG